MIRIHQKFISIRKRGIGSIIGTLLLIAITVVGGTITAVTTENLFNTIQVSGYPEIDYLQILGYDTRSSCTFIFWNGFESNCGVGGPSSVPAVYLEAIRFDERIAVYVVNHSVKKVLIDEVRFGGGVYSVTSSSTLTIWNDFVDFVPGQYAISDSGNSVLVPGNQEIQPGQTVTLILDLESDFKIGRTVQMRIETANGAVFVKDIKIGEITFFN